MSSPAHLGRKPAGPPTRCAQCGPAAQFPHFRNQSRRAACAAAGSRRRHHVCRRFDRLKRAREKRADLSNEFWHDQMSGASRCAALELNGKLGGVVWAYDYPAKRPIIVLEPGGVIDVIHRGKIPWPRTLLGIAVSRLIWQQRERDIRGHKVADENSNYVGNSLRDFPAVLLIQHKRWTVEQELTSVSPSEKRARPQRFRRCGPALAKASRGHTPSAPGRAARF